MKREGRQHGTVRTYCILPSGPLGPARPAQRKSSPTLSSPPTAGIFTRVPAKPTNHSKFTGKCGRARCTDCHLHPSWKSKDKIKGARAKLRSSDVDLGHGGGLLAWRVTGQSGQSGPYYKVDLDTQSASEILDELYSGHEDYYDDYRDYMYDDLDNDDYRSIIAFEAPKLNLDCLGEYPFLSSPISREINEVADRDDGEIDVDEDDDMGGFFDVAIVWDAIDGDEGWTLVGEM